MSKVFLICGKICCGKTAYSQRICKEDNAVLLSVDEITLEVLGGNLGENHDEDDWQSKSIWMNFVNTMQFVLCEVIFYARLKKRNRCAVSA